MILVAVNSVPIWEKANLNLEEAAAYFGIGINKLRDMTNENNCPFVLWNGNKRLIKRRAFERFLDSSYSMATCKIYRKKNLNGSTCDIFLCSNGRKE